MNIERVIRRADRLTDGVVERAKGVNQKADGYSWDKFRKWLQGLLRKEFENHEMEILGQIPVEELESTLPLVIYFGTEADRQEFVETYKQVHPKSKTIPL